MKCSGHADRSATNRGFRFGDVTASEGTLTFDLKSKVNIKADGLYEMPRNLQYMEVQP